MTAPARTAAYHALRAVSTGRFDLPTALAHSRRSLDDERDRALAAAIVVGTLRWQRTLDHLITHFARRPVARMDEEVLTILRSSMYQLLHLDRVPAAAVVDDAVDLTRAARKPSAAGFVNAILRSLLRQRHRLPLPARPDTKERRQAVPVDAERHQAVPEDAERHQAVPEDAERRQAVPEDAADYQARLAYLGITHSHPDWLVDRWLTRYGFEAAEAWTRFNNDTPGLTIRVNTLRASVEDAMRVLATEGIVTERTRYAPSGLVVTEGNPLRRSPDGLVFVQDEASQLVPLLVDPQPGERILDLCASPGGKTTAMAAAMRDEGLIVACDVRPRRVELLRRTVEMSGARRVRLLQVDSRGPLPMGPLFDRVLVDAPCSGLGTIRRDPDIRWRRRAEELAAFADDQVRLLDRAAAVLGPGGRLVYATCSSEPEENEEVVDRFLASRPDVELIDLRAEPLPAMLHQLVDDRGMFRTLPFRHGLEAFFGAVLRRIART
ncbi:MAG TPA: transcription antitermination factor NusB [Vicinamibacterales bacterium]|nr:transcription antitermination factor NusB [Vicinamibacterales bacterium]